MVHLLITPILSFFIYSLSSAYREQSWPPREHAPYPPNGYPSFLYPIWGGPRPFQLHTNGPNHPNSTPTYFTPQKATAQPPRRNEIARAECRDGDKLYRPGDKWTPKGGCGRYSCSSAGKTTVLGCPSPEPQTNCSISAADPRQPWPFCCPQLNCA